MFRSIFAFQYFSIFARSIHKHTFICITGGTPPSALSIHFHIVQITMIVRCVYTFLPTRLPAVRMPDLDPHLLPGALEQPQLMPLHLDNIVSNFSGITATRQELMVFPFFSSTATATNGRITALSSEDEAAFRLWEPDCR